MDASHIQSLLISNESLFNHIYVVEQKFDIIPTQKHYGMAIDFIDIQESRTNFIEELVHTIIDWVYSRSRQKTITDALQDEGKSSGVISSVLVSRAHKKFRRSDSGELLHGQFGELLLANCIQKFFKAVPILRKMRITTSTEHERFGADAIHYRIDNGKHIIILGEAKSYTSDYQFNTAFKKSIESILDTYKKHQDELKLYIHEDFLEPELENVATKYLNNKLKDVEIHLASVISYNEKTKRQGASCEEIRASILRTIRSRFEKFDKSLIDIKNNPILDRITYIVFPVWDLEQVIELFAKEIGYK